jgi:hypothetical protein
LTVPRKKMECNRDFKDISQEELDTIEKSLYPVIDLLPENYKQLDHLGKIKAVYGIKDDGLISHAGFLKQGEKLRDIYQKDMESLNRHQITTDQIADLLTSFMKKFNNERKLEGQTSSEERSIIKKTIEKLNGNPFSHYPMHPDLCCSDIAVLQIDGRYVVFYRYFMGSQTCPFQHPDDKSYHGYNYGCRDYYVYDTEKEEGFGFGCLLPHMIREHQFFEGSVPYRVDPEQIIRLFEMKPGVDYNK